MEQFQRTIRLIGENAFQKIRQSKIAVFGVGGVGGHAVNALARCGVENFYIVDKDVVDITNINRQMVARLDTVGQDKVDVVCRDIMNINRKAKVETKKVYISQENLENNLPFDADYVLDCIDDLNSKAFLIKMCYNNNIPILSCMGAGNRLTADFKVVDINKTFNDPVAKIMRKKLKDMGVNKVDVVWSEELPQKMNDGDPTPASISFVPSAAGLKMAEYVINQIIKR